MALEYKGNTSWAAILPVLDEHAAWFNQFIQSLFYVSEELAFDHVVKPDSFSQWVLHANRQGDVSGEIIEKLATLNADLFKSSSSLLEMAKTTSQPPPYKNFKDFITLYEEFMIHVRRLERDMLIEGSGYDSFTGLRSVKMFEADLEKELDRLARQGKSFCVSLGRIDRYQEIKASVSSGELNTYIKLMAELIKLSIRTFDDAYYMGENEFALSLKQADVSGGISALERLRRGLEQQNVKITLRDGSVIPLSISCCIVEPVIGHKADELIENLRDDLEGTEQVKTDTVLEYRELSPLQRYIRDGDAS